MKTNSGGHMTPEEEFNETERTSAVKQELIKSLRKRDEDDDIQTYKQPWKGLTDKEIYNIGYDNKSFYEAARMVEEMLKWRNT
jgi:hypothetical protein